MRLIKIVSQDSISFTSVLPESQVPPYAILSHRWGKAEEEVTYDDILNGNALTKAGLGPEKIRFCIQQSRRDGLQHFWMDTCCIDKRNNTELSESLISMYKWYANARKCYVYLDADWTTSTWWNRGWTLQELMASRNLEFFEHGRSTGTKVSREREISEMTRIPVAALRGGTTTISERRQWQQGRETERPEDIVYSMLGLLNISMPVLYGEGRQKAEQRLEHEINIVQKGVGYKDFSLIFSLAEAPIETQFIARTAELDEIKHHLSTDGTRKVVILHGLGGIGKTQLSIAYAQKHKDNYSAIIWLNARDVDSLKSSFVNVAKQIIKQHPDKLSGNLGDADRVVDEVKTWFSLKLNTRWLIIYDNYDDPPAFNIRDYIPEAYQGCVIITTRSSDVQLGHSIHIRKVGLDSGIAILQNSSKRADDATKLARRLDGLPLALATAGAYLKQSTMTYAKYLDLLDRSWAKLQQKGLAGKSLPGYEDRTLYSTWQISFDQIEKRDSNAANLLRLWAYFDNQDLWYELLNHTADTPDWYKELVEDELTFEASMQVLCEHGLVEANSKNEYGVESTGYSMHTCVHDWTVAVLNPNPSDLPKIAVQCVCSHLVEHEADGGRITRRLLNHARRCAAEFKTNNKISVPNARHNLGVIFLRHEDLEEAKRLLTQELKDCEKQLGTDHESPTNTMIQLGVVYEKQGNLREAENMYKECLTRRERSAGKESRLVYEVANQLAGLYMKQKKLSEAEQILQRMRNFWQKEDPNDKSYYTAICNLGMVKSEQGAGAEAVELLEQGIEGLQRVQGEETIGMMQVVNNLGNAYRLMGKLHEAEIAYRKALTGREKMLGPDHGMALESKLNLGTVYQMRGNLDAAKEILSSVLEKASPYNDLALHTANALGVVLTNMGELDEAEAILLKVHKSYVKMFGNHISSVMPLVNLSKIYQLQKKLDKALDFCIQALDAFGEGYDDPALKFAIIDNLRKYGNQYATEDVDKAQMVYERCFKEGEKHLGMQHLCTRTVYQCLGQLYKDKGKSLIEGPTAGMYYNNLAGLLTLKKAEVMYLHALNARLRSGDHKEIVAVLDKMRTMYRKADKPFELMQEVDIELPLGEHVASLLKELLEAAWWAVGNVGTILHAAAYKGYVDSVVLLLDAGIDINIVGGIFTRPLIAAAEEGHLPVVKILLDRGADVNAKGQGPDSSNSQRIHALQTAARQGHLEIVEVLLEKGAHDAEGGYYGHSLQAAAFGGHLAVCKLLLQDVNASGGHFGRALQAAAEEGHLEIVQLLLDNGADVDAEGGWYGQALIAACFKNRLEVVKILQGDVHADGKRSGPALQAAAENASVEVVQLLLDRGAKIDGNSNGFYGNPLQAACARNTVDVVRVLLDNGADINREGGHNGRALQAACSRGAADIVQLLLDRNVDVNVQGGPQGRALVAAANQNQLDVVKMLIDKAEINAGGATCGPALQTAAENGHIDVVKTLLEAGADVNLMSDWYGYPLQAAAAMNRLEIVGVLLEAGADVNAEGGTRGHAIEAAAEGGDIEVVKALLDAGADVDAEGGFYGSALQAASVKGHLEVVKLLLSEGASADLKGGHHGSALRAAKNGGHQEVVEVLLAAGARG